MHAQVLRRMAWVEKWQATHPAYRRPVEQMNTINYVKAYRQLNDLTQDQLAQLLDVSRRTIIRWERNPEKAPNVAVLAIQYLTEVQAHDPN